MAGPAAHASASGGAGEPAPPHVIMPVLNEAAGIAGQLAAVRALWPQALVVVVDGGSEDGTLAAAREAAPATPPAAREAAPATPPTLLLEGPHGRAAQMNHGARMALEHAPLPPDGWLLFLHADTALPAQAPAELARAARQGYRAGAFPLRIVGRHPMLPLLALGASWRTRLRHIALGDQAQFVSHVLFEATGGFPPLPIMEDYAFSLLLRERGEPLYLARHPVITSGRRWDKAGFWRTWWRHRLYYRRFHRDYDLDIMRKSYYDVR